ncbi:hypothetical protein BRC19_03270 [Candidatus Saccharibacteria bacterium QS_5_54_17]|nr:MAG: hypothetical protein BRC19_03270 [Candidatus Saccharibacteria bacterium QS_5_54_17]
MQVLRKLGVSQEKTAQVVQIAVASAVIIDYSVSETISQTGGVWFYILPGSIIAVALAIPVSEDTSPRTKVILSLLHYGVAGILLITLTGIFGPYFQFLILLVFASVVWFQVRGMVYGLLAGYAIIIAALWWETAGGASYSLSLIGLYVLGLTILAVLFERVTARYRRETTQARQLHEDYDFERTRLLSLINSMADAVVAVTKSGEISLYNGAVLDLFNTNQTLQGKPFKELVHLQDEDGRNVDVLDEAARKRAPVVRDDLRWRDEDGSTINVYTSVSPVSAAGSSREHTGFIIVMRDITKQKTLDEQRDEFISVTSHELRTPIAVAEANISTALMPDFSAPLTNKGKELLNQAHENILFLSNLVNDLNMLAKAEQDRITLDSQQISPADFVRRMAKNHQKQIDKQELTLETEIGDDIPNIRTNRDALREILQNFITNAIKYTPEGTITLRVYWKSDTQEVVFAVADTGIGMSKTDQKHVFEKFFRSEDYRTRRSGGTGLGLYIMKRLAERLNGRIWFESKLNKGSTFYCALPSRPSTSDDAEADEADGDR